MDINSFLNYSKELDKYQQFLILEQHNKIVANQKMMIQLTTPVKQIIQKELKNVDSQQVLPITFQQQISSRLMQNAKIIEMISNNRFQRSRSRRKEHLEALQNIDGESNKKIILKQIVKKLDSALKQSQSRSSLSISRKCLSEQKQFQQKVKQFENALRQIKQNNTETQQKIKGIKKQYKQAQYNNKNQYKSIRESSITTRLPTHYISQYKFKGHIDINKQRQRKNQTRYQIKGGYVYPKYIRPDRRMTTQVSIQPYSKKRCNCKCKCAV